MTRRWLPLLTLAVLLLGWLGPASAEAQPAYNLDGTWWVTYSGCGSSIFDGEQYVISSWDPSTGAFSYYETPQDTSGTGSELGTTVTVNGSQASVSGPVASNGQALTMTLQLASVTLGCGQHPTYTFVNVCPKGNLTPLGTPAPPGTPDTNASIALQAGPIVGDQTGDTLSTTATLTTQRGDLQAACAVLDFTPSDNLADPSQFVRTAPVAAGAGTSTARSPFVLPLDSFGGADAVINEPFPEVSGQVYVAQPGQTELALGGFEVAPGLVVQDGFTLPNMNKWGLEQDPQAAWGGTSPVLETRGGGRLVFSDRPEYISQNTEVITEHGLKPGGSDVEGVLYRESGSTDATAGAGDFRIYLNHENRTNTGKAICVVITNPAPKGRVTVTELYSGQSENAADPVKAGQEALQQWEAARHHPAPTSHAIGPRDAWTQCLPREPGSRSDETLGPSSGSVHRVVNAILDFSATGRVQAGVVVVNSGRVRKFEEAPLSFHFEGGPKGDVRTYEDAAGQLENGDESPGHVRGTFPYDAVSVTIGTINPKTITYQYDLDSAIKYGVRLVSKEEDPEEYAPALDTGAYNAGNYGVDYSVVIPATGSNSSEQDQVLINPRGIGPVYNKNGSYAHYTNGYDGVVDVPANPLGAEIPIPDLSDPNLAKQQSFQCPLVGPSPNLVCTDLGVGIGMAKANQTFSFAFMPPGGAALPVAVVLIPAFVKVTPTVAYDDARGNDLIDPGSPVVFPINPPAG